MVDYTRVARLLLLADDAPANRSLKSVADAASCRIFEAPLAEAAQHLANLGAFDAMFVSLTAESKREAGAVLDMLKPAVGERLRVVIDAPPDLVDLATSHAWGSAFLHVSEPTQAEQAEALARSPQRLNDSGRAASRLQQLSQEAGRIASALASLSESEAERESGHERPVDAARIRAIIRARRLRDQYLGADLFADPAWDMLLDLMAARYEGQRVPVSSLCMAAAVPPTTALRWIKALSEQEIFVRIADPEDGRRIYIELADEMAGALEACLRAAQRISPIIF